MHTSNLTEQLTTPLTEYPTCIPHPHHQTPPLSQALQVSFKYPLSMRGLREFFKSYVHTRVHYVRVDSDSQYPKVSVLLI
jgi:hypothetical protein